MNDKISWTVPVLAVIAILEGVYFLSCLLGVETLSFFSFGGYFILGSVLGYVVWVITD